MKTGIFRCRRCQVEVAYSLIAVERWFTLFGIAVVKSASRPSVVECASCGSIFDQDVLPWEMPAVDV